MNYHLGRDGSQLGSFPEEEIRSGLSSGRFLPTDLAWCEGMADWKLLSEVLPQPLAQSPEGDAPKSPLSLSKASDNASPSPVAAPPTQSWQPPAPTYGGYPAQPHYGVGVLPTPGTAIASLVLGIVSFATCYFGVLFIIPGIICGHIAMNKIKTPGTQYGGRGLALAGLILNYVYLGLFVIAIFFVVVAALIGNATPPKTI